MYVLHFGLELFVVQFSLKTMISRFSDIPQNERVLQYVETPDFSMLSWRGGVFEIELYVPIFLQVAN